jgi:DNA-binding HxlR family transcriptional regulator
LQVTIKGVERQGRSAVTYDATVAHSPLAAALERVGDRWSLLVVEALLGGPRRWSDLAEDLPGIAPNILSDRLRRLEREALVTSAPYSRRPVRLRYELTAAGKELAGALRLLADWGAGRTEGAEPIRHRSCGTPVEARWYCPTCDRTVAEGEAEDLRFV